MPRRRSCPVCHEELPAVKSTTDTVVCPRCGASVAESQIGKTVASKSFGRFELLGQLGQGAFSAVYRAYDTILGREVALKVPRARVLESPIARARFLREPK